MAAAKVVRVEDVEEGLHDLDPSSRDHLLSSDGYDGSMERKSTTESANKGVYTGQSFFSPQSLCLCLLLYLSFCLSVWLSVCFSLSVCLSVCLSLSLFVLFLSLFFLLFPCSPSLSVLFLSCFLSWCLHVLILHNDLLLFAVLLLLLSFFPSVFLSFWSMLWVTFNWHYSQTIQLKVFIHAMLTGTIDFWYLVPLSLTLTLLQGHKASTKQNLLASCSHTLFNWSGWNRIPCGSNSSWTFLYYFWMRFIETREITAGLLTVSKKL